MLKRSLYRWIQNVGVTNAGLYTVVYNLYDAMCKARDYFRFGSPLFNIIAIETSTYCNRRCYYCPNSKYPTPKLFMEEPTFHRIVDGLAAIKFSGVVHFNCYNEPLLDTRLPGWIGYCRERIPSAILKINSNGDYLTMDLAQALQDSGLASIYVTIHDSNPAAALSRISLIQQKFPKLILIKSIHRDQLFNRGGAVDVQRPITGTRCIYPLKEMIVDYRGDVLLCCNDYFHKHVFGSVLDRDLISIWFDKPFLDLRKKLNNGVVEMDICRKCLGLDCEHRSSGDSAGINEDM